MELDSFLASPRWEILQIIAKSPSSPIEIAKELNTTVSYASQQLKLLEAAGLVKKQRTGAVEKGKPRSLFSLAKEAVYITPLTPNLTEKKLLSLNSRHKAILKIWYLEDEKLHSIMQKLFWKIEKYLDNINGLFIESEKRPITIIILSEEKEIEKKLEAEAKKLDISIKFVSASDFEKIDKESLYSIYNISSKKDSTEVKGGKK